jgi:proline racemase
MELSRVARQLKTRWPSRLITVDSHTAGESTRLIVGGIGSVSGTTMADKLEYFRTHHDRVRLMLTREPRGHRDLLAALVTEPTTPEAKFGLIYMDARRYPFLCGHATIGAVTTLIEGGILETVEPETAVIVDTPSGPVATRARIKDKKVESVALNMVPSFVYPTVQTLEVPGLGGIRVELVCVGGFFVMVAAEEVGLKLVAENRGRLISLGMEIIEAANRQLTVRHPERPEVCSVDVTEFYDPDGDSRAEGRSVVVYGEAHMDRCPCGTGTAAKMTLLHHKRQLGVGQPFFNHGPLGTRFEGRVVAETRVGDLDAVVTEVAGSAQITGIHEFVLDSRDPFPEGFLL